MPDDLKGKELSKGILSKINEIKKENNVVPKIIIWEI